MPLKPTDPRSLGGRIRARRREIGISQSAIAEACDVDQTTVSGWEHGKSVPSAAAVVIADMLGVTLEWLLRGNGQEAA